MHDVCTEQHVGNAKCASPPSLSFRCSLISLPCLFLALVRRVVVEQPSASFVTGAQGETSTIKPTILNEQAGATNPRGRETHVTAASRPSVGSGGELVLVVAWLDACTGQHAFREGWERARGTEKGGNIRIRSYSVCRWSFDALQPLSAWWMRRRGSSVETLIAWIKWLLVFV